MYHIFLFVSGFIVGVGLSGLALFITYKLRVSTKDLYL